MLFRIDTGKISTREMVNAESTLSGTVRLMAKFMIDEGTDQPIPEEKALELLLDLPFEEQLEVQDQFRSEFLPKVKRRRS